VRIVNNSAAGAIYETAGRVNPQGREHAPMVKVVAPFHKNYGKMVRSGTKNQSKSNNPNAGKQFIDAANATGVLTNSRPRGAGQRGQVSRKFTGRLIYRAWSEDGGKTQDAVIKAIMKTNDLFVGKTSVLATSGFRKVA
jgi:hypothetical protein